MPKRGRVAEKSFMVFEVYYKYGEYDIKHFHSTADLRGYLADKLRSDRQCLAGGGYERKEDAVTDEGMSLDRLIACVIEIGRDVISEEAGYGVVCVQEIVSA